MSRLSCSVTPIFGIAVPGERVVVREWLREESSGDRLCLAKLSKREGEADCVGLQNCA